MFLIYKPKQIGENGLRDSLFSNVADLKKLEWCFSQKVERKGVQLTNSKWNTLPPPTTCDTSFWGSWKENNQPGIK